MKIKQTWISSDYHLGHKNVIKYDNRPFKDLHHMNETIIANHNAVVLTNDDFYFLGDFSFDRKNTENFLTQLNGNKFFIKGNHDHSDTIKLYHKYGTYLGEMSEVKINEHKITLCHYAMRLWNRSHHGEIHLYGHSHGELETDPYGKSMDVGIMNNNYTPFNIQDVIKRMDKRDIHIIDHHVTNKPK